MSFADANRASIRIIEEATWGTTPTSGVTREVRLTSSSLSAQKETVMSDEIRADRMVSSITEVAAMSSGDINFEFASGTTDEFLAAFVMGAWTRPMTNDYWSGVILSVTSTSVITARGLDLTGYLVAGRRIKLDGFRTPANNGYFQITSVEFTGGNTVITVTVATLVIETGTPFTRVYDANDVALLRNTTISASAAGFASSATAFAAARAAGQIVVGQKIFVDGLGKGTGTVTFTAAGTTLSVGVNDGVNAVTLVAGTNFAVGGTVAADAASLAAAINGLRFREVPILVNATSDLGVVTVSNLRHTGGTLTEAVADANVDVVNFAGGVANVSGVYTVLSVTDALIAVTPAPGIATAGAAVTIKASLLRNPSNFAQIAQRKFSIETGFNDIGQFQIQDGMVPGTFSLEIATGAIITGTIGFEGRSTALRQTTLLGNTASYTVLEAAAGEVVNATTDVGNITKDGTDFLACIQSLSLSGEANLRQQACVGSKFSQGIGAGRFNLTGSLSVFFEDENLFNDFLEHETVALSFSITDPEGYAYYWTIPAAKFTQDEIAPGGIDQDVIEGIEFTAFRDPTTQCMLQVDRFSPNAIV